MRVGQPATVTADIYGSKVVYEGKVVGIGSGTGSIFSIIPPQNATGNWIKIVQRVPVRISIPVEQVRKHPLVLGLTTYVDVNVMDNTGKFLHEIPVDRKIAKTYSYDIPMGPAEDLINKIIKSNVDFRNGS
jgi:membrane fusion protein (multidrug efflux system)